MTTDILTPAQENHNTVTKSGYQWLVWWFGNSAGFTTPRRAQEELARLQRYEAPQKQALSLLETLYTQYDSMAEQYEAMTQYIKTTFSLEKLNKVIDQLTADLLTVSECHPQLVQQAQAQALGTSMEAAIVESREVAGDSEITVADSKSPALSPEDIRFDSHYTTKNTINVYTFDEKSGRIELGQLHFITPDGDSQFMVNGEVTITFDNTDNHQTLSTKIAAYLNGEMRPQPVQQAQAQAVGASMEAATVESREVAGDSEITVADSPLSAPSYDGLTRNEVVYQSYLRGLIEDRTELARLAPIAPLYEYKLNVWRDGGNIIGTVAPKVGMSVLWGVRGTRCTITAITAWGVTVWRDSGQGVTTTYPEHLSDLWVTEDTVSPASIKPIKKELIEWTFDCQGFNDDGLLCQHFIGRDTTNGNQFYRTINQHGIHTSPYKGELTLGDFVEAEDEYPRPIVSLFDDEELRDDSLGDLYEAPTNPNDLAYIVTSVEANIFTLQAPANSHIAKVLQAWLIVHEAIEYLEPCGYSLAARLKADFGFFVTPKTLTRKIKQTLALLKEAKSSGLSVAEFDDVPFTAQQEALDNVGFIWSVIKKLEALAC